MFEFQKYQLGDRQNCYWNIIGKFFNIARKETTVRSLQKDQSAIDMLETLFSLISRSYEDYVKLNVKLHLPLIGSIMQGPELARKQWQKNVQDNFSDLLYQAILFQINDTSKEFSVCMVIGTNHSQSIMTYCTRSRYNS